MPAYWILGERRALWVAFCKKWPALEALGLRIRASSAVLCVRSRARGLRDAENSRICTPPPGVPAGKKQPPRRNMQSAGRFIQKGGCGRVNGSLELESQNRLLGTLKSAGQPAKKGQVYFARFYLVKRWTANGWPCFWPCFAWGVCRSASLLANAAPRIALNIFGKTVKVVERDNVIGKQVGYLITHGAAANIVHKHS